jgi:hypothetical protein
MHFALKYMDEVSKLYAIFSRAVLADASVTKYFLSNIEAMPQPFRQQSSMNLYCLNNQLPQVVFTSKP